MDRKAYIEYLKKQLDEWNAEIDTLEAKVDAAKAEMKEEYEKQMRRLYADRETYKAKLNAIADASEGAWEDLRQAMEQSWEDMRRGMLKAHSRFKDD